MCDHRLDGEFDKYKYLNINNKLNTCFYDFKCTASFPNGESGAGGLPRNPRAIPMGSTLCGVNRANDSSRENYFSCELRPESSPISAYY